MEAFSFMKFWLSNNTNGKPRREIKISESAVTTALRDPEVELCEGDDSFFELEISLTDSSLNKTSEEKQRHETTTFSKSKVLPVTSKPKSPTTVPKSGQKFRAFSFKKSNSEKSTTEKKEFNNRSLNVRFKIDDEKTTASFRKTASTSRLYQTDDAMFEDSSSPVSSSSSSSSSSSKRFFSLIKPFNTKSPNKQSSNVISTSPVRNIIPFRNVRKQLGKSRSASPGMSPANRVDESLQVQQDEIQSAILHCKKSFHGSRESSLLSRSTSDSSSQEKLSTSSSEDSYLLSRIVSDSMSEKSMESLTSINEQQEKMTN